MRVAVIAIGVLGLATAGIPPAGGATTPDGAVKLRVSPSSSLMDVPLTISVHGLKAKASATLRVTSMDVNGVAFTSEATFRANGDGVIDSAKVAPLRQLINSAGATPEANSIALAKIWPRVLDFLAKPPSK